MEKLEKAKEDSEEMDEDFESDSGSDSEPDDDIVEEKIRVEEKVNISSKRSGDDFTDTELPPAKYSKVETPDKQENDNDVEDYMSDDSDELDDYDESEDDDEDEEEMIQESTNPGQSQHQDENVRLGENSDCA